MSLLSLSLSSLLSEALADSTLAKQRRRFNVTADLTYTSSSIETKDTASTLSASTSSTFSALEIGGDYFFHPKFAATAQMLFTLTTSIDSEIKGFDVGVRYYPWNQGFQSEVELLGSRIETTPGYAVFLYGGFSGRDYQFGNTSISFQGPEAGAGMDFHFSQHVFFRGALNYQFLRNTTSRTFNGPVGSVGMGYSF